METTTTTVQAPTGRARCADGTGRLAELFFSDDAHDLARAKAICRRCALAESCLAGALERVEYYGVWGGVLVMEGVIVEDRPRRGRPPRHPRPELVVESVRTFADPRFGVDLFKLESPLPAAQLPAEPSAETLHWFEALNKAAARPWVLLSAGVSAPEFARVLTHAYAAGASGFLAGRAIWAEALHHWPDAPRFAAHLAGPSRATFERFIGITKTAALPWFAHPGYGSGGAQLAGRDAAMEMQVEPQMARSMP